MALQVSVEPLIEPVTTQEIKDQVRQDIGDDDTILDSYVKAAREYCEMYTGRAFINQTLVLTLDDFPPNRFTHTARPFSHHIHHFDQRKDIIFLRKPPFVSLTSVQYIDTDGNTQTFTAGDISSDTQSEPGRIVPAFGKSWPTNRNVQNSVTVTYVAGYGTATTDVPETIKVAIKLLASHWYENRENTTIMPLTNIPKGVDALLWSKRILNIEPLN